MDLQCDQIELHSRSRLKIRRPPSCKISATTSSSFHGICCRPKKNNIVRKPLIFYTVDPEIVKTEPAEFMWVVQMLTGSPDTCRLLRTRMQRSKEMQQVQDVQLMQQGIHSMQQSNDDSLKEGTTTIINANLSTNDLSPPLTPNPSDLSKNITPELPLSSHANQLICKTNVDLPSILSPVSSELSNNTCSHPLASPLSSDTNQLDLKVNHPSSVFSSNSAISAITPMSLPLSAKSMKCGSTNYLAASPLCAKASDDLNNTSGAPCSPVSPSSSLTTTSEGYLTDNFSTEGGAWEALCFEQGNTSEAEEDGIINFFDFSQDSYYGNFTAAQHEVEFHLDSFYQ